MKLTDKALKSKFLSTCAHLAEGRLTLRTPDGATYRFGTSGPEAEMTVRDWAVVPALAARGHVGLGETYVQGLWDTPCLETLLALAIRNRHRLGALEQASAVNRMKYRLIDTVLRANSRRGSACRVVARTRWWSGSASASGSGTSSPPRRTWWWPPPSPPTSPG